MLAFAFRVVCIEPPFSIQDTYIGRDGKIYKDHQQDCELLRIDDESIAFKRKFDTCDPQDFHMHEGTMYLLWSRGSQELTFPMEYERNDTIGRRKREISHHGIHGVGANDGTIMAQLLRADKLAVPEK